MKLFLLLAGVLAVTFLQAQRISAIISAPDKDVFPDGNIIRAGNYLVGFDEGKVKGRFMGFGFDGTIDKLGAVIYDTNMNVLKAIPLTEAASNHGPLFTDIQVVNGTPYIIYHQVRNKTVLGNIMAIPIDLAQQTAGKALVIGDVDKAAFEFKYSIFSSKSFSYSFYKSPDRSHQLILAHADGGACFITVLDENMNILWTLANIFTKDEKANLRSAFIDNSGNVLIALQRDIKDGVDMRLVPITQGKRQQDIILNIQNASWFAPQLLYSKTNPGQVEIAGLTVSDKSRAQGIFRASFDLAQRKARPAIYLPFSDSLMNQLDVDGWANSSKSSKKYGVSSLVKPVFQQQANGNIVGMAELEEATMGQRVNFYRYGPILYFSFAGEKGGFTRIPKNRVSTVSDVGAYGQGYVMGNETVVFYNDNPDNLEKDLDERAKRSDKYKNHVLIAAFIQPDGSMRREVAVDLKDEDYLAETTRAIALSGNKWLIPFAKIKGGGRVGSSQRWAIVTVK